MHLYHAFALCIVLATGLCHGALARDDSLAVVSVDPDTVSTSGGDMLSIEGMGMWETDKVLLGDVECMHVLALSNTRLQCETPAVGDTVPRYEALDVTLVRGNVSAVGAALFTWRVPRSSGNGGIAVLIGIGAFTVSMMATFMGFTCIRNYYQSKAKTTRRPQVLELGLTPRAGAGRRPSHGQVNDVYRKDSPGVVAAGGHVTVAAVDSGVVVRPVPSPVAGAGAVAARSPAAAEQRGVSWDLSPDEDSGASDGDVVHAVVDRPPMLARALGGMGSSDSLSSEDAVVSNIDSTRRKSWFSRVLRPKPSRLAIRDSSDMHELERQHAAQQEQLEAEHKEEAAGEASEGSTPQHEPAHLPPPANVGWWSIHSPRWHSPRDRERAALKVPQGLLLRTPSFMQGGGGVLPESHVSTLRAAGVSPTAMQGLAVSRRGSVVEALPDALAHTDPRGKPDPTPRNEEHMWVFYGQEKDRLRTPRRFKKSWWKRNKNKKKEEQKEEKEKRAAAAGPERKPLRRTGSRIPGT